jgi:glycosyltransferase involved in cell wall biosynthesis
MMKLLHVHERAMFHGGVEQILHDTARGLSACGWEQALLHAAPEAAPDFLAPFHAAASDRGLLARFNPDVVLLHKVSDTNLIESITRRYPAVRMVHDHDLVCLRRHKYFPLSGRICDKPAGWQCYSNLCFVNRNPAAGGLPVSIRTVGLQKQGIRAMQDMRHFIVGSRWMHDELVMNGIPADRIRVIHPIPASLAQIQPLPCHSEHEILYVGQVIRGKGVDLLLHALARLDRPWHATIVGAGNHLDSCRRLAMSLGIASQVEFTGWVRHEELEAYYTRAAFTVVPSRWPEPFGMVGVEAMARGRAVVGFDAGGIRDWLSSGINGVLAPAGNVEKLAGAIDSLLADPDYTRTLGEQAARLAGLQFTHGRYLGEMQTLLEEVA